ARGPASPFACGPIECGTYPGMVALVMALAGLPWVLRTARGRFWAAVAVGSLGAASGVLPIVPDSFRGPARVLGRFGMATAIRAGLGTGALRSAAVRTTRSGRWAICGAGVLVGAAVVAVGASPLEWRPAAGAALALAAALPAALLLVASR